MQEYGKKDYLEENGRGLPPPPTHLHPPPPPQRKKEE